jgi:hypothetical protein
MLLISSKAHLGMQASLPMDLVPMGASILLMVISTSCAIFLAIGQSVFQHRLVANLSTIVPSHTVDEILSVGATRIREVVSMTHLPAVLRAYSTSTTQAFGSISIWHMLSVDISEETRGAAKGRERRGEDGCLKFS